MCGSHSSVPSPKSLGIRRRSVGCFSRRERSAHICVIRVERAMRKNSQLAAARRVALKMGRLLRCSSVTYRSRYAPLAPVRLGPPRRRPILNATKLKGFRRRYTNVAGPVRIVRKGDCRDAGCASQFPDASPSSLLHNRRQLSPGEQNTSLRRGEIDVALTDQGAELLSLDFFARKLAAVSSVVILATSHPLASKRSIRIAQLRMRCS
jgi:hypothetical protein